MFLAHYIMPRKKKRRLTDKEVKEIRDWMARAPMGNKPTIRQIARAYGVNQPSVIKSLGGWKGIRRGRPDEKEKSRFHKDLVESMGQAPIKIEGYTQDVKREDIRV